MTHASALDTVLAGGLSDDLLAISRRAIAAELYETAYHALAGALHGALAAGDATRLRAVGVEALEQQAAVNAAAPGHRLSRHWGRGDGDERTGWFDALAVRADAALVRQRGDAAMVRSAAARGGRRPYVARRPDA